MKILKTFLKNLFFVSEVIEFPAIAMNLPQNYGYQGKKELVCDISKADCIEFRSYVKPVINKTLTDFCTELTGITQEKVENAPLFLEVWQSFLTWLKENHIQTPLFVTCGDWDLKTMLRKQAALLDLDLHASLFPPDHYFLTNWLDFWANIKRFVQLLGVWQPEDAQFGHANDAGPL